MPSAHLSDSQATSQARILRSFVHPFTSNPPILKLRTHLINWHIYIYIYIYIKSHACFPDPTPWRRFTEAQLKFLVDWPEIYGTKCATWHFKTPMLTLKWKSLFNTRIYLFLYFKNIFKKLIFLFVLN
jgi:hypothetical protein